MYLLDAKFIYSYPADDPAEWWHIFYLKSVPVEDRDSVVEHYARMLFEHAINASFEDVFDIVASGHEYRSRAVRLGRVYLLKQELAKVINASSVDIWIVADMWAHVTGKKSISVYNLAQKTFDCVIGDSANRYVDGSEVSQGE